MGKALYREYRPKSLDSVVGQDHITNTLRNAIKKGSISHAYLFTGPRGVGKTSVARILAHEINGIPYSDEYTELDIIEIDAASNRRIDEIRDLRDKVHIAPTSHKYKVYIIDEVHMLTREAFNALLKTLEEPPEHAVFILATTESHKVPETIISRTQRFSFKPIDTMNTVDHLKDIAKKENIKITDEALVLVAEHGNGSFRDSISMLDQLTGFSNTKLTVDNVAALLGIPDNEVLNDIITAIEDSNVDLLFTSMQKLRESGANSTKTAQQLIKTLRDTLINNKNLDSNYTIKLMKSLLPLTGAQSSFEAIEISVLDSMEFEQAPNTLAKPVKTEATPANDKEKVISEVKIEQAEARVEQPEKVNPTATLSEHEQEAELSENNEIEGNGSWNDVLSLLKVKHNTLYGFLRMADTKVEGDKIILTFQFEFHKKQINQTKNIATLKSIVDQQLGKGYTIESDVKKKTKTSQPKVTKIDDDNTVSNVSNIFGGAELLES